MVENNEQMLSAGKLAENLGVSAAKVKKVITELGIEPSMVKCRCNYYSTKEVEKIKQALK